MDVTAFTSCLSYYGVATGTSTSLEGVFALNSGYTSGTTGIYYNQLHTTGSHFINGQLYSPTLPLINVYNNIITNNTFSGHNGLKVGSHHSGDFAMVLDIEYSGCTRQSPQKGMVLLSTASSITGLNSGFVVGITETSRLYFNTSGYSQTLDKELGTRDFVFVSLGDKQYVTIGIFSLNDNKLYKKSVALPNKTMDSNEIYLGNFLTTNLSDPYTGFVGKINQAILFNDTIVDKDVGICANCSLATGYNTNTTAYSWIVSQLTGVYFSGVVESMVTGTTNVSENITLHNGSTIKSWTPSGMTGFFTTGQFVVPMFSGTTIDGERDDYAFLYDTDALNAFSIFSLYFNNTLTSGDTIEVYTYPQPNVNIGKLFNGLNWPTETGTIQLIANGLNETLNVDYGVSRNQISGEDSDNILSYDVLGTPSIVTAYSGFWNSGSRLLMDGGGYYPAAPQYLEDTGRFTGIIKITGLAGVCTGNPFYPRFGYDLHMNGQKLISGMYFDVTTSGVSGFVVSLSGNQLPQLIFYPLYDPAGGDPTGVSNVDDSELAFIPQFADFRQARYDVTGDSNTFSYFTGFGEQVWVNGIRYVNNGDYIKVLPCSMITGVYSEPSLSFSLYDSESSYSGTWNIVTPPSLSLSVIEGLQDSLGATATLSNINGYTTSGNCLDVWTSQLKSQDVWGDFYYEGVFATGTLDIPYTGFVDGNNYASGIIMARYHKDNIIGQMTNTAIIGFTYVY